MTVFDVHRVLALVPRMTREEFSGLVEDIRRHGLLRPIVLTNDGKTIVDGRQRLRACAVAGVAPRFERLPAAFTDEDLGRYVLSANVLREHQTPEQTAAIDAKLDAHLAAFHEAEKAAAE